MGPRRRASTLKAPIKGHEELESHLKKVAPHEGDEDNLQAQVDAAHLVRQYLLIAPPESHAKDAFRHLNGFSILLDTLERRSLLIARPPFPLETPPLLIELIQTIFSILSTAFESHEGNRRYFKERVRSNGWQSLHSILNKILGAPVSDDNSARKLCERVFGCLLACALEDESVVSIFAMPPGSTTAVSPNRHNPSSPASTLDHNYISSENPPNIDNLLSKVLGPSTRLVHGEAALIMLELWKSVEQRLTNVRIAVLVPKLLRELAEISTHNACELVDAHVTSTLLSEVLHGENDPKRQNEDICKLSRHLFSLGVDELEDACLLYRNAKTSSAAAELLLYSLNFSPRAPFVQFDLSLKGYCSIELPSLAQPFPPTGSIGGYTVTLWVEVVKFDPHAHTTLFGAFDSSQTCFLLIYLEKDTHNLILQTSIKSSKPSVRFKSFKFKEGHWYHMAITHRRPKATSSSRASLFIDGEFVEEVKSQYPALPARTDIAPNVVVNSTSRNPVQAFLGTPQDLASRVGKGVVQTIWRLCSAQLFSDILSDDLIAVYFRLGPRYTGNYQDCLGSFQTYEASAQLSLRNESLHPGKDEVSDLVTAIRSKGGEVLPESRVLLNISSIGILGGFELVNANFRPLDRVSKPAFRNLLQVTQVGRNPIALNGAFPSFDESLLYAAGHAVLTGCPTVVSKDSIDRSAWRLGGCTPVCLSLLDSSDIESLLRNMQIFFSVVENDWRNSEAVERDNGFSIFIHILSSKLKKFDIDFALQENMNGQQARTVEDRPSLRSLNLILEFVGLRKQKPQDSIINNPLAYRLLLVDTDIWRSLSSDVQEVFYAQFHTFLTKSKYHGFNAKRLSRMRIVKKWIESLRYLSFSRVTFEYFLDAFKILTLKNFTSEVMRSLALYITYAIYEPENVSFGSYGRKGTTSGTASPARRKTISTASPGDTTPTDFGEGPNAKMDRLDVAVGMLEAYNVVLCQKNDRTNIDRFARAVTNKWLLYLLADTSPSVLVPTMKILGQLLISSGPQYMKKFTERANGVVIMQHWLQRHWNTPALWIVCFAILFGQNIADVDFNCFDHFSLIQMFGSGDHVTIVLPEILPVIMSMFRNGLISVTHEDTNHRSALAAENPNEASLTASIKSVHRPRASSLTVESANTRSNSPSTIQKLPEDSIAVMRTVTRFLADVHEKSLAFRDLAASSLYIQELFQVIYPVVVGCGALSAETELNSRASDLTFKGEEVAMKPFGAESSTVIPTVRASLADRNGTGGGSKPKAPRRMSSYVLVTSKNSELAPKLQPVISPKRSRQPSNISSAFMQEVLEILLGVFTDQIFVRKDFPGMGLFMRVPAGFQEHQAYFETFVFRNALSHFSNTIKLNQKLLWEPRVLTNIARLAVHLGEAVYEGWFIEGAYDTFQFLVAILEYLQIPAVSSIKSVRLCHSTIESIQAVLHRIILLRLSDLHDQESMPALADYLDNLAFWQTALFSPQEPSSDFLRLLVYLLYTQLDCKHDRVRSCAANLWRQLLVHKTNEISEILDEADLGDKKTLSKGFEKIMELDNETFLTWFDDHRSEIDGLFKPLSRHWTNFVVNENCHTEETAKARIAKRRERLKMLASEDLRKEDVLHRHEISSKIWRTNIYHNEHAKRQRTLQDQHDARIINGSAWERMQQELCRPYGLFEDRRPTRWRLDETEGRNRMRMRLIPDKVAVDDDFQPKRRKSGLSVRKRSSVKQSKEQLDSHSRSNSQLTTKTTETSSDVPRIDDPNGKEGTGDSDDDFEMVENPHDGNGDPEDKHRKVMRCIQRGDLVEHVDNASRIVGLEAIEGLLICGKHYLYLLDDLFRRIDGEIINAAQAPEDERDQYLQMISGHKTSRKETPTSKPTFESRNWRWDEILSLSKRRFLFRDVAIEIFFVDGQSYLLTTKDSTSRDEIYQRLQSKAIAPSVRTLSSQEEYGWRIESLRNPDEESQSLGTRFTSVFAQQPSQSPATRRWIKGEISNFHYLMLINTMAGRSYNDLTQYPVFPWIIADYTSDELDLSDPRSFRDLSKPMGCQTEEREAEFKDRYQSFSEMADENAPPFHYGTHYSSAMIVTSYLIRLQPFVQSYLLLQGGSFDHADRLFFSIEKAWKSASRENMSDVRELIPEFYYSPEFLSNMNNFDLGERQSNGARIDNVALPPWAKNDPKIFIAKQREALESEYVTRNLHAWIDLVFGHKQRGIAALEATNVFHHLSYHGAKDLDAMEDPVERLATIGIIHNFGQTPLQVFNRPHPHRDQSASILKRLDMDAESLVRLPFPVLESPRPVFSLHWSVKTQKMFSSGPSRLVLGPTFDKYVEWGFFDGSVRFYVANGDRLIGLFEHIHVGHVLSILFADPKTMVTASTDCTVSIWTVTAGTKSIDLQPKKSLFGHKKPVIALATSRSFSVLLSGSTDGVVILWDLNRGELVRVLTENCVVECAKVNDVTGHIMLCQASEISVWTLNGELVIRQGLRLEGDDLISSCAFFEGNGHEYLERQLLFTGHKRGVVDIWDLAIRDGAFVLEHVKRLHHMDQAGFDIGANITAILPMEHTVYTGDDDGRVYEWDCVQRQ